MIELVKVLAAVQRKLPLPLPTDEFLMEYIAEVEQSILNFCNIRRVPDALFYVFVNMTVDAINSDIRQQEGAAEVGGQEVASVKTGDVTVQFRSDKGSLSERSTEQLLFSYKDQLLRFRRMRW